MGKLTVAAKCTPLLRCREVVVIDAPGGGVDVRRRTMRIWHWQQAIDANHSGAGC